MASNNNHLVIMAGGIGSRFWPMSTKECPKQFIDVMGCGRTLIQLTVDRFEGVLTFKTHIYGAILRCRAVTYFLYAPLLRLGLLVSLRFNGSRVCLELLVSPRFNGSRGALKSLCLYN